MFKRHDNQFSLILSNANEKELIDLIDNKQQNIISSDIKEMIEEKYEDNDDVKYDALSAKQNYNKYLLVRNSTGFLQIIGIIFSFITFNLQYQKNNISEHITVFVMIANHIIKFIMVITYIYSLVLYGDYMKSIAMQSKSESFLGKIGYFRILLSCIFLYIQPFVFLKDYKAEITEYYWDGEVYIPFSRPVNHYLYII